MRFCSRFFPTRTFALVHSIITYKSLAIVLVKVLFAIFGKANYFCHSFVRMLQGLVEGLISVSMSLTLLSSRLDFLLFIICPLGMSSIQMTMCLD